MFKASTPRVQQLADKFPNIVNELDSLLTGPTHMYVDWQNVIHFKDKLGWRIDEKRLMQFLRSFGQIKVISLYTGTLEGNMQSENCIKDMINIGYKVETKPVKLMPYSVNASSVPLNSPALLQPFIKKPLLSLLNLNVVEFLNNYLAELNKLGTYAIEDKKCNFDVEIGRDLYRDLDSKVPETFVLWSGDSDFVNPIKEIMDAKKRAILFASSGLVATELAELKPVIFEVKKIKEFICWKQDLSPQIKAYLGMKP
ncbi:MAG: NYN domain-containing protein [Patescibacteria group bacterium]